MVKKPIILIMTSRDESGAASQQLAAKIREQGTHNVVIISDEKYGSAAKLSALDKLMDTGQEYQYLLARKDRGVLKDKLKVRKFSKRVNRINNMLKRFRPEYILCMTPYAHHCAAEAKRKARFSAKIIYFMQSFTVPKRDLYDETDVYIVENSDVKQQLVRLGVHSKDIMTMGLPYDVPRLKKEEIASAKQEFGLPRGKTVYVDISSGKELQSVFALLMDQGDIASYVVNCANAKLRQTLNDMKLDVQNVTVLFVPSADKADEYLSVCDIAVIDYNVSVIYKCFRLGVPSIIYSKDEHVAQDVGYLTEHNLVLKAKEDINVVGLLYKLIQTPLADEMSKNGLKWVEANKLEDIANFLVTYIAV